MISNAGSMRNRGFEFAASWNGQAGDMTYTITGNLTYTKNKVLSLGDGSDKVDGPCITKVGETIASFTVIRRRAYSRHRRGERLRE